MRTLLFRASIAVATVALAVGAMAQTNAARFVVENYSVVTEEGNTLTVTLKLDSSEGDVWRLTEESFTPIEVKGKSQTDDGYTEGVKSEILRQKEAMIETMRRITIPGVEFRAAALDDVVLWMREQSVENDPKKEGISFVVKPWKAASHRQAVSDDPFSLPGESTLDKGPPKITLSASQINLYDLVCIVTDLSEYKFRVKGPGIILEPLDARVAAEDLVVCCYKLPLGSVEGFSRRPINGANDWQVFLAKLGVAWPTGTSVQVAPTTADLVVRNTVENIVQVEEIFMMMGLANAGYRGRYRFARGDGVAEKPLLLFDTDSGRTWKYVVQSEAGGWPIRKESFELIPARAGSESTD